MSTKFTNVAIVAVIVAVSSLVNFVLIAPKKVNAAQNVLQLQRRVCTNQSNHVGSASDPTDPEMSKIKTVDEHYVWVNTSWNDCSGNEVISGIKMAKLDGGSDADGVQFDVQCCRLTIT
jgi:hypothetical protein